MIPKIGILGLNFGRLRGPFCLFQGQKSRFFYILKVVLVLFRSCLGILFDLRRSIFRLERLLNDVQN